MKNDVYKVVQGRCSGRLGDEEAPSCLARLVWAYTQLRMTGRGKHVGGFSYYHVLLVSKREDVLTWFNWVRSQTDEPGFEFNVVKLNRRSRVSFLRYEDFGVVFPSLLGALTCDLIRGTVRTTSYAGRRNPPILHRKELLLPADSPLVPGAARLTKVLEGRGAFSSATRIGTRDGWMARLALLGLRVREGELVRN